MNENCCKSLADIAARCGGGALPGLAPNIMIGCTSDLICWPECDQETHIASGCIYTYNAYNWHSQISSGSYVAEPVGDNGDQGWQTSIEFFIPKMHPLTTYILNGTAGGDYWMIINDKCGNCRFLGDPVCGGVRLLVKEQTNDKCGYVITATYSTNELPCYLSKDFAVKTLPVPVIECEEILLPISEINATDPVDGISEITMTNTKDGVPVPCNECARLEVWISGPNQPLTLLETISGLTGQTATQVSTDSGGFTVLDHLTDDVVFDCDGTAGLFYFDKQAWAIDTGYSGNQNVDIEFRSFVGGDCPGSLGICPEESEPGITQICRINITTVDNQAFNIESGGIDSDNLPTGSQTIFSPYANPAIVAGIDYGVLGSMLSAPACAVRSIGNYFNIAHFNSETILLTELNYSDGSSTVTNDVVPNPSSANWGQLDVPILAANSNLALQVINASGIAVGVRVLNFYTFVSKGDLPFLTELKFEHSCDPTVPIILSVNLSNTSY